MAITIDWMTKVITCPQADLTPVSGTLYELDTEAFRNDLHTLQASEEGMVYDAIFSHNTEATIVGVTYARLIEIINGYSIVFTPDSAWSVRYANSNNNMFDVGAGILVQNNVQVIAQNSAGLINTTNEAIATDIEDIELTVANIDKITKLIMVKQREHINE